jgi:hypothetical protein
MSTIAAPPRPQADTPRRYRPGTSRRSRTETSPTLRKVLGPSVILVGVGIATGEYIGALAWCFAFFGVFSIIYGVEQFKQLF